MPYGYQSPTRPRARLLDHTPQARLLDFAPEPGARLLDFTGDSPNVPMARPKLFGGLGNVPNPADIAHARMLMAGFWAMPPTLESGSGRSGGARPAAFATPMIETNPFHGGATERQIAANTSPPGNDNYPRQESCTDAGHECLEHAASPSERDMCATAERACNQAADAARSAPENVRIIERFPHGRTVVIPGGGVPPYLGPSTPPRRQVF